MMEPFACNEIHIEQQQLRHVQMETSLPDGSVRVRVTCWLHWALKDRLVSMFWQ